MVETTIYSGITGSGGSPYEMVTINSSTRVRQRIIKPNTKIENVLVILMI